MTKVIKGIKNNRMKSLDNTTVQDYKLALNRIKSPVIIFHVSGEIITGNNYVQEPLHNNLSEFLGNTGRQKIQEILHTNEDLTQGKIITIQSKNSWNNLILQSVPDSKTYFLLQKIVPPLSILQPFEKESIQQEEIELFHNLFFHSKTRTVVVRFIKDEPHVVFRSRDLELLLNKNQKTNQSFDEIFDELFEDDLAYPLRHFLKSDENFSLYVSLRDAPNKKRITISGHHAFIRNRNYWIIEFEERAFFSEKEYFEILKSTFDNSNDSIIITEAEPISLPGPKILYVNHAFELSTGYRSDEVIGKTPRILQGEKTDKKTTKIISEAIRAKKRVEAEVLNYRKDGSEFWASISITPIFDIDGVNTHWVSIQRDITLKKEQERLLNNFFNLSRDGICVFDDNLTFIKANNSFIDFLGYAQEEIIGRDISEFIFDDFLQLEKKELKEVENLISDIELPFLNKEDELVWLRFSGSYDKDDGKIYASVRNITLEKEREAYLSLLEEAFDKASDAIIIASNGSKRKVAPRIEYVNQSFLKYSGYSLEEVLHKNPRIMRGRDTDKKTTQKIREALEKGEVINTELLNYRKDGQPIWVSLTISPVERKDSKENYWISIQRDITQRKKMEIQLKSQLEMERSFNEELERQKIKLIESESRFNIFMQNAPTANWITDVEGNIIYLNETYFKLTGLTASAIGKNAKELFPEDFVKEYMKNIHEVYKKKKSIVYEEPFPRPDGKLGHLITYKFPVKIDEQVLIGGIAVDVTELEWHKQQLIEKDNNLKIALEAGKMGIWKWDIENDQVYWSDESLKLFGYSSTDRDVNYQTYYNMVVEEDRPKLENDIKKAFSNENGYYSTEHRLTTKTGKEIWLFGRGQLIRDELKRPKHITGIFMDITDRKEIESDLQKVNELHRILAENSVDMIWVADLNYNITYITPSVEQIFGYTPEEFKNLHYYDILTPKSKAIVEERFAQFTGEEIIPVNQYQIEQIRKDGKKIWTEIVSKILYNEAGEPTAIIGTTRDISDRIKANNELLNQKRLLATTGEIAKVGGWEIDVESGQLTWTDETYRIFDVPIGTTLSVIRAITFYETDQRPIIRNAVNDAIVKGKSYDLELKIISAKGKAKVIHTIGEPIIRDGKVMKVLGAIQDITERKKSEDYTRMLQSVVINTNDAVIITEAEPFKRPGPRIVYVNKAFCRMTGYSEKELIGDTPRVLQGAKTSRTAMNKMRVAFENWQSVEVEILNYKKDGTEYWAHLSIIPVADSTGYFTHWISVQRDITEERRAKEILEEKVAERTRLLEISNKKLEQFASIASHDMKAPLRMITSFLQLLNRSAHSKLDEREREFVHHAINGAKDMNSLIEGILAYSRINKDISYEVVDFNHLIHRIVDNTLMSKVNQVQAKVFIDPMPTFVSSKVQMQQLFLNLINNALKFNDKKNPTIHISYKKTDKGHLFSVKDNGIGMKPDLTVKIFEIFTRLNSKKDYEGHGIGLSICKEIVENHNGKIWVESEEGAGSEFFFYINEKTTALG